MSTSEEVTPLVAEDDDAIRKLLAFTLREAGFTVITPDLRTLDIARHRLAQDAVDLDPPTPSPPLPV